MPMPASVIIDWPGSVANIPAAWTRVAAVDANGSRVLKHSHRDDDAGTW